MDVGQFKIFATRSNLIQASPYINVELLGEIPKVMPYSPNFEEEKNNLNQYDIIFDCSTDNEMAFMLDVMKPDCQIINFSLTNKAKTFICAVNEGISEQKYHLIDDIEDEQPNLWVGTGCQYPTFEASNLDIQTLLNYGLKNIECQFKYDERLRTFTIKNVINQYSNELKLFYLNEYIEPVSNLRLYILEETLKKIEECTYKYHPKETGGILVGSFSGDNKTVFIKDCIQPDTIDSSPSHFTRLSQKLNDKLKELHLSSKGELVYVGEWHSHPNSSSSYSSTDFKAMKEIAHDTDTRNKNPILIINGIKSGESDFSFYLFKENNLLTYKKTIEK